METTVNNRNELESIATYYTGIDYTSRTETVENLTAIIAAYKDDEEQPEVPKSTCTGFKSVTLEPRVLDYSKRYELQTNITPVELRNKYHINGYRSWYNTKSRETVYKLLSITSKMRTVTKYQPGKGMVTVPTYTMVARDLFLFARKDSLYIRAYEKQEDGTRLQVREEAVGLEKIGEIYEKFSFIIDFDEQLSKVFSRFIVEEGETSTRHSF